MDLGKKIADFLAGTRDASGSPLLVLLGPTASGKTVLSLELAREFNGEIISADSRQVYRGMDIGTDKIPLSRREGIAHHLIDVADPSERFTVADFKLQAETAITDILARGKLPMLVGGTGLYIRAITQNFSLPPENPEVRAQLNNELAACGPEMLHKKLAERDPENAAKIHPRNAPYIVRALEIFMATGHPKTACTGAPRYNVMQLGLSWPREILFERIHRRIDEQIANGLVEETKQLLVRGFSKQLPSMQSLGYREMVAHLEGALSLADATELLKKNTRNFAKRQMTWFKRDSGVIWTQFIEAQNLPQQIYFNKKHNTFFVL